MVSKLSSTKSAPSARRRCSSSPADTSVNASGCFFTRHKNRHNAAPSCKCAARNPSCSPADFTAFRTVAGLRTACHSVWASAWAMRLLAVASSAMTRAPWGSAASTRYMSSYGCIVTPSAASSSLTAAENARSCAHSTALSRPISRNPRNTGVHATSPPRSSSVHATSVKSVSSR